MTADVVREALAASAAPRTLLARLKDETRDVHQSLERDLGLLSPNLDLERYRWVVERFYGFYAVWEPTIRAVLDEHMPGFWLQRSKIPLLLRDLAYLGSNTRNIQTCGALPQCRAWPDVLGAQYVIEGSTLGGQIIGRHLAESLGLAEDRGIAFFSGYGVETGRMWRSFCAELLARTPGKNEDPVVEAARQTFICLHSWLCGVGQ